ncbi:MAG: heavy metal-binding domain-containing protein, partial [Saprospiraceae bacterium]|nr:heavy metal-binding domain-containing protein [Saprospiraceae bacterium]
MRYVFYFLVLGFVLVSQSCKDGDATNNAPAPANSTAVNTPSSTPAGGVEHYICPNGHAGKGGEGAGTCSECGATLEHNTAYHDSEPQQDLASQTTNVNDLGATNPDVEHYICPNGHAGSGGAGAGQCAQCGAELSHNDAFHNTPPPADIANQANNISPATQAAPSSVGGVEHYICPNGHVGSGGAGEGTCTQCQAALVHNDAFHNNPINANPLNPSAAATEQIIPQPSGAISPVFQNAGGTITPTVGGGAPGLEPAQNSSGVWHYVCPDGHAGGAGSEQACAQCGKTLAHNTIYHQ